MGLPSAYQGEAEMLAKYLDAWYPIIASWNGRLVFLDGFAGRGRYTDGSEGSPLIALRRLIDHRFWPRMSHREFIFIFVEHDQQNAGSLQAEIDAFQAQRQPWPANVKTEVVHGTFDLTATEILEQLRAQKANLAPTFAFVDPFGYSGLPMKLLAELLAYPKTELFVNFVVGHVQRFITRDKQQRVMGELFGIDVDEVLKDWDPADVGRVEHLRAVYERQLKAVALIGRWRGQADTFSWDAGLEADGEFVECDADPLVQTTVDAESVVAASQVLHERPPSGDDLQ